VHARDVLQRLIGELDRTLCGLQAHTHTGLQGLVLAAASLCRFSLLHAGCPLTQCPLRVVLQTSVWRMELASSGRARCGMLSARRPSSAR
jgi:hypothetical protein